MDVNLIAGFAGALFAIVNPFGNLPIFIATTSHDRVGVRQRLALYLGASVCALLLVFFFAGGDILNFFGISLPAFKIAGGVLLLLIGLGMIRGHERTAIEETSANAAADDDEQAKFRLGQVMVPLGVPIFVGPGSIATVILYADRPDDDGTFLGMIGVIVGISVVSTLVMMMGDWIRKVIGETGLDIFTRIMGLILAAIAVQFMLGGLSEATVNFINSDILH
jgi:MarC family membrane protein